MYEKRYEGILGGDLFRARAQCMQRAIDGLSPVAKYVRCVIGERTIRWSM